ncbi:hypothetical protein ABVT39_009197 [Epinephelus coioides]
MDTAAVVTLLALVVAMAGISQALHIQGSLDKNDILPGSEEDVANHLLGLVWSRLQRAGSVGGSDAHPRLGGCTRSDLEYGRAPEIRQEIIWQADSRINVLASGQADRDTF